MDIRVRRVYDGDQSDDGYRVLIDRLWPRGRKKGSFSYDEWPKAIAPSADLRRWYSHDPAKHDEFVEKYTAELDASPEPRDLLARVPAEERLTLLTAEKDPALGHAWLLADYLRELSRDPSGRRSPK